MRILCVGKDPQLLRTRCQVLTSAGFDCEFATPAEVENHLRVKGFDLCILSALVSDQEKAHVIRLVAGSMPILKLETLVLPPELLKMVQEFSDPA